MKSRFMPALLVTLLLTQGLPFATAADSTGSISYRRVYELLYQFRALPAEQTSQVQFLGRVVNPMGETPDRLLIQHGDEPIVVPVDAFGLFDVPFSPQLAQLNPKMIGEPAAPILKMGLAIVIRLPAEGVPDLASLREGVRQTNAVMLAQARVAPERVPQARGVTLRFAEDGATVALLRNGEWRTLTADKEGRIDLPLDEQIADMQLATRPQIVFPLFP